jgi:hypothetical protein
MRTARSETNSPQQGALWGDEMRTPDDVAAMLRLGAGLGHEADRRGARLQPQYGEALHQDGRLDGVSKAAPDKGPRRAFAQRQWP